MKMPPPGIDNKNSRLLNYEENLQIFRLLGNRCQSLCTTVAQLFCTEPPIHSQWIKKDVGVLCFVKDNSRKNYFFRLFCLKRNMMVWEQEMYKNMEYNDSTLFLHIFEGEDMMVAFNFASTDEAKEFKAVVDEKLMVRRKREERRQKQMRTPTSQQNNIVNSNTLRAPHDYRKVSDPVVKQAKRKRNITKADIGVPLDFKHISHVGWNPDSGFDIDSQDEQLKCFFEKAGISEKQLQDRDTKEFIYDFINKHGGREAIEESTSRHSARKAPALPPFTQAPPVPPVPPRGPLRSHASSHRVAPPPPPAPASITNSVENEKVIPPPPPPLADLEAVPPPPVPAFDLSQGDGPIPPPPAMGSALLDSIKTGTTLRPVEERKMPTTPVVEDSRGQLMKEIQKGLKLKPVCERDVKPVNNVVETRSGDLAEALARALAERSKAIHSEDDDDEEDSNDDEWED
ncbi:actin nucleation-promoting factor WASL [Tribolium castaneum]|uniref:Wiskott-Aldrich syndrome protein-like Protein n=1 Tax=Tribolium castaneum TaxID=7070 RepID=D6WMB8_TRICA|nr:PREDICTED: neural Wiskott-Aldrich syndrome protein [Tribolium castaneum]XP_008193942.1 PREDICTED: neural Wiskott-Aldrich syndrome protein [Tribolium castaneum]XP_015836057.1 PREDICTED: neural Wiskott-Aldrich syndrome protein [Tribolium castaneum]EFA03329.2 Wiskott-Aldrich syndrome protein-like Protein [Tribolium castaneum]|eukprot:XP_008193941.1 PREDICTED: neural Wiskott-Aldrich syndrome protein [Tribolium castaneum]